MRVADVVEALAHGATQQQLLADFDYLTADDIAAALLYAARVESGGDLPAITPGALNATQGMIVTTAIMKAVNLQVFELGLWQSWANG